MWVIFVLSAFCFAILTAIVMAIGSYIGNKMKLKIKKDNLEFEKEMKEKSNE